MVARLIPFSDMSTLGKPMNCEGQFIIFLIFTTFIFVTFSSNELQYQNQIDAEALLELKMSIKKDPSFSLSSWVNANNICNWTGITCDRNHRVVSVDLKNKGLSGTIPPHIGNMSFLTILELSRNYFSCQIPHELGKLGKLQKLHLFSNNLIRIIPEDLANCTALKRLDLRYNLLTGTIPKSLGNCTKFRVLLLSDNMLEGPIPSEILTSLTRLVYLYLELNKLSGSIPQEIGKLWRLREIFFDNNELTGSIPMALQNCSSLEAIGLSFNSLYGTIPAGFSSLSRMQHLLLNNNSLGGSISFLVNCTELIILNLMGNKLQGRIPEAIGYKLSKLERMELGENQLSGSIPKSLANCSALYFLETGHNNLSGAVPSELGMLTRLQVLLLGNNRFRGNVHPFLSNCTQLVKLGLEDNRFMGSIPADFGLKLTNLQEFTVGGNQFSGGIPKSLGNCSQLSILDLSYNLLSGVVPQELGMLTALHRLNLASNSLSSGHCAKMCVLDVLSNCSFLGYLNLSRNHYSGTISRGIGNLSPWLSELILSSNNITGNIPEEIGNLTGLIALILQNNSIIGNIPSALGRLWGLQVLDLSFNKLQGSIPPEFNMLLDLQYLWLQLNNISGGIPSYIGSLQQLRGLDLSHNKLTGRIPDAIGLCYRLQVIDLSYNSLTGNIPMEISKFYSFVLCLNFSHNSLMGRLPSLGGLQHIQAIDISANKLSGPIPGDIGSCVELQSLNLAENKLEGIVPISIGQLKSIESIDLSFNKLSGPVQSAIANLTKLRHLNFSYNDLIGLVPNQGAFRNLSATSVLGNPRLCAGSGWLNLPNCTSSAKNHHGLNRNIVLVASVGTFFALCCILGAFYIINRRIKIVPLKDSFLGRGFMKISSQELHRATQGFSAANLLGQGNFGSVYKGLLYDNTLVAVKVFDQDPQNSYRNFVRECTILSKIRHRNLVKVLSSCSTEDFSALVLQFMSKGSLEQHLHKDVTQCSLNLKMRLNIALDVAHGMAYLHHDCSPPVLHCDLKPSNVLMDDTLTAHVTDFGISRLLTSAESPSSSMSRLNGTIGYLAPEYGLGGQVTTKGDVYSFGMLTLEMVTKKRPTDDIFSGDVTLPRWVKRAFPEAVEGVVDRELLVDELESSEHGSCLLSFIGIGVQCTRHNPRDRPTMREVEGMLEKIVYGRAYGNLEEHASVQNLLSVGNGVGHPNSGSTSFTEGSQSI